MVCRSVQCDSLGYLGQVVLPVFLCVWVCVCVCMCVRVFTEDTDLFGTHTPHGKCDNLVSDALVG